MPNQSKPKTNSLPDLSGLITKEDIHQKGGGSFKADYVNWAKTTQYLREHAPGWDFHLEPKNEEYVWAAPDNTGYLMCYFQNGERKTPLFPFPIMDNRNNPLPLERINSRHLTDSHRRGLCACSAFTFGLAYELWARIEIEEANQPDLPSNKQNISRTPNKPAKDLPPQQKNIIEKATSFSVPTLIGSDAASVLTNHLTNIMKTDKKKLEAIKEKFFKQNKMSTTELHVSKLTAEQGSSLTQIIQEFTTP